MQCLLRTRYDDALWCPYCGAEQAPPDGWQDETAPVDGWQDDRAPANDWSGENAAGGWQNGSAPADNWDDEPDPPDDTWTDDPPVPGWADDVPYAPEPRSDAPRSKALLIAILPRSVWR
ncbi:MAG: hypothetical protein ACLTG4_09605 [Oscillospiraceae bacterium]